MQIEFVLEISIITDGIDYSKPFNATYQLINQGTGKLRVQLILKLIWICMTVF